MIFLTAVSATTAAAEMYKWVDERGVVHYSESPPPGKKATEVPIEGRRTIEDAAKQTAKTWRQKEEEFQKRRVAREKAEAEAEKTAADEKHAAAMRKEACIQAQRDLHVLRMDRPVYTINEKGERAYLSDEARPAAIESAKQRIEKHCTSK